MLGGDRSAQAQRMRSFTIAMNGEAGSVYKGPRDYLVRRPPFAMHASAQR